MPYQYVFADNTVCVGTSKASFGLCADGCTDKIEAFSLEDERGCLLARGCRDILALHSPVGFFFIGRLVQKAECTVMYRPANQTAYTNACDTCHLSKNNDLNLVWFETITRFC